MRPYVYLAEPIDQSPHSYGTAVAQQLESLRVPFFRPRAGWRFPGGHVPPIVQAVNMQALGAAEAIVACIPRGVPTIGVPMEIQHAADHGKPVVLLTNMAEHESAALAAVPNATWTRVPSAAALAAGRLLGGAQPSFFEGPAPVEAVAWFTGSGEAPRRGKSGDAGYDLVCSQGYTVEPGERVAVPCDIAIQLPEGYWGLIQGRSSSWRRGLSVKASVIDAGYRGDLWVDTWNIGSTVVQIEAGERIAQLIPLPLGPQLGWQRVSVLEATERGTDGYGSTGR